MVPEKAGAPNVLLGVRGGEAERTGVVRRIKKTRRRGTLKPSDTRGI